MRDSTPILVGAGQLVDRDATPDDHVEPLAMLERTARTAAAAAGAADGGEALLRALDGVSLVQVAGWKCDNSPQLVGERLGARPRRQLLSRVGGETGIALLNDAAGRIAAGRSRVALVAGCHNVRTLRAAHAAGRSLDWASGGVGEPERYGERKPGSSEQELHYGLAAPTDVYPVFENALRFHRGLDLATHRERMGRLFSRMSEVAAANPYAWFPTRRSPEELVTVTPRNRMIAFPYPKYLNAVIETDQAAALLLTSVGAARELGIPAERWVGWWGGGGAHEEAWFMSERPALHACPALRASVRSALAQARVELDAVDRFDFYSCFPVAVEMACEMLGLAEDDPRGFSVTGGLPYAGGPGSSYTLHAVATLVDSLRERPGVALATGNGWYLTKHSAVVLGSEPRDPAPPAPVPAEPAPPLPVVDEAHGTGRVEGYTVVYDREGAPRRGIVVGRLPGGERFLANTPDDRALLEALVAREVCGLSGPVHHDGERNRWSPA